jgi:molecular chaperone Hsp33
MEKSRQYSFINNQCGFTLSLIEGKSLIADISKIHNIGELATDFYKKSVLSTEQLINFLKPGENLGFYIDSEEPYFRFKIEMAHNGSLRTLLLPEEFDDLPQKFTGKCRLTKILPNQTPYTSILDFENHPIENVINEIMLKSYQTKSEIISADDFSSTLMITKLPPTNINKKIEDFEDVSIAEFKLKFAKLIQEALKLSSTNVAEAESVFEEYGFSYIGSKEVKFHCPCSKERMIQNLYTLDPKSLNELFNEDPSIETRCDYCNSTYEIKKEDINTDIQ